MTERELTFADLDRLAAEREVKKRELIDRLAKVLAKEFSFQELRFIQGIEHDSIRIEAYEIARTKLRG